MEMSQVDEIGRAERDLGVTFPRSYADFMRNQYPVVAKDETDTDYFSIQEVLRWAREGSYAGFPPRVFPFRSIRGNGDMACFDYRGREEPWIVDWDHECAFSDWSYNVRFGYLAGSYDTFLKLNWQFSDLAQHESRDTIDARRVAVRAAQSQDAERPWPPLVWAKRKLLFSATPALTSAPKALYWVEQKHRSFAVKNMRWASARRNIRNIDRGDLAAGLCSTLHLATIGNGLSPLFKDSANWLASSQVKDAMSQFPGVVARKVVLYKRIAANIPNDMSTLEAIRALPHCPGRAQREYYELILPVLSRLYPGLARSEECPYDDLKAARWMLNRLDWSFLRSRPVLWNGGLLLAPPVLEALRSFLPESRFEVREIKRR
jgi:hypothetical protein